MKLPKVQNRKCFIDKNKMKSPTFCSLNLNVNWQNEKFGVSDANNKKYSNGRQEITCSTFQRFEAKIEFSNCNLRFVNKHRNAINCADQVTGLQREEIGVKIRKKSLSADGPNRA